MDQNIRKILEILADIPPTHPIVVAIVSTLLFGTTALIFQTFENRRLRKELEQLKRQLASFEDKLNNIDRKDALSPSRLENNIEINLSLSQLRTLFNEVITNYNIQHPLSPPLPNAQPSPRDENVSILFPPDVAVNAARPLTPTDPNNNNNIIPQTPVVPSLKKPKIQDKDIDHDTEAAIQQKLLRKSQSHLGSQSAPGSLVAPRGEDDIKSILKNSNRNFQSPLQPGLPIAFENLPDGMPKTPVNKHIQGVTNQIPSQHIQWQSPIEKRVLVSPPFSPCTSPRMESPLSPASPHHDLASPPISPVPKDPPTNYSASSPIPIPTSSPHMFEPSPDAATSFIQTKEKKSKSAEKQKEFDLKNVLAKIGVGARPSSPNRKSSTTLATSTPILKRSKRSKSLSEQDNTESFPRDIASILAPLLPPSPSGHVPAPLSAPTTPLSKSTPALRVHRHDYISAETQSKSTATKHFFFEYYWNLFFYLEQRQDRLSNLKQRLEVERVDNEVAGSVLRSHFAEESNKLRKRRMRMKANDFQILAKIGRGGFGDVFLCRQRKSQEVFAMKRIKRAYIDAKNKTSHIQLERAILSDTQSPWLVKLYCSFQDHKYLYLVMEYVPGGDMRGLLSNVTRFTEADAAHYIAEMIVAVIELHKLGFIHRDLKPENFLITKEGHLKLGDFGLSKKGLQESTMKLNEMGVDDDPYAQHKGKHKNKSMVGSPNYMAIEILKQSGYDFTIDFWSIGVMLFELIVGIPPFDADVPTEIFENILNYKAVLQSCYDEIRLEDLSQNARDLINSLICEPENRLGRGGLSDFKNSKFLQNFDWDHILELQPPFVPTLASEEDHRYFELSQSMDDISASIYFDKDDLHFKNLKPLPNFTYINLEPPVQNSDTLPTSTNVGSPIPIPSPRQPVKKLSF